MTVECLTASLNGAGDLVLEGQDLGPSTSVVSPDGEYEWITLPGQRRWTGIEPAWPSYSATSVLKTAGATRRPHTSADKCSGWVHLMRYGR